MTTFQLPQKKPLYEQVIELIEEQIISGDIRVGDQLPTEKELAVKYQVSRTVIREAMKALKQKGWIETHVGKGTFVVENVARGMDSSFDLALRMDPGSSFRHLIEVRDILEPEIAALAAVRANEDELVGLRSLVDLMEQAVNDNDYVLFLKGDLSFHVQMAEAAGNPLVLMIINRVVTLMRAQQEYHVYHEPSGCYKSQQNHKLIMTALEKRDPDLARACMSDHIHQVYTDVHKVDAEKTKNFSILPAKKISG